MATAFVAGRSHDQSNIPCQDFAAGRRRNGVAAIALADGAGSRANSGLGAKIAVDASLRLITSAFDEVAEMVAHAPGEARRRVTREVNAALGLIARRFDVDRQSLASTLLFVARKEGRFVAGHLGDGVIATVDSQDRPGVLSHPDNGEYANMTYFVTDDDAEERLRLYRGNLAHGGFILMSDGTAEVLYERSTGTAAPAVCQFVAWTRRFRRPKVEGALRANLAGPLAKSSDDLSLAVLSAMD